MRPSAPDLTPDKSVSGDPPAVLARGLRKTYSEVEAVAGIDLRIEQGEIFAFLGPNGAGKTTAVEILEGFRPAHRRRDLGLRLRPGARDGWLA